MIMLKSEFRVYSHHLEPLSSEDLEAPAQIVNMIECLSEGGDFEPTLLEALDMLKKRFPGTFEQITPRVVDVMAAVFAFHGHDESLERLRALTTKGTPLRDAFENGKIRGDNVRLGAHPLRSDQTTEPVSRLNSVTP